MTASSTVENYLKALHQAQQTLEAATDLVPMGRLAGMLGVVPGTATTMVKALAESGLVEYEPYAGVRLSPAGERLAALVLRRHRLVELFLVDVMGMSWAEVHDEAERLEHAVSERLIERIDVMLGRPHVDPHGDPIPRADGSFAIATQPSSLLHCPVAEPLVITRVVDQDAAFLEFLGEHGLRPGERIAIEERDAVSDRVTVRRDDREPLTLGMRAASKVLAQPVVRAVVSVLVWAALSMAAPHPLDASALSSASHAMEASVLSAASSHAARPGRQQPASDRARPVPEGPRIRIEGIIRDARTRAPVEGALVEAATCGPADVPPSASVEASTGRAPAAPAAVTTRDGRFVLPCAMRPTTLHVRARGYLPIAVPLAATTGEAAGRLEVALEPEPHYTESISVSPDPRDRYLAAQPTAVVAGQDLARMLEGTLGALLADQPGMAQRAFGPGASRPVIRGLDGDRVLVLEDGQRTGDLSSQSADHGINVNPAAAERVEIVRGPATLLYGANAIGGIVNVVSSQIPAAAATSTTTTVTLDAGSGARDGGVAGVVRTGTTQWALTAGASARRGGRVRTPTGLVANSQTQFTSAHVGVSRVAARGYGGLAYAIDGSDYGIPLVGLGDIRITPVRHTVSGRGDVQGLVGPFESARISGAWRRYRHEEIEGGLVGTVFTNDTFEADVLARHRRLGRLQGTAGAWFLDRRFAAVGAEALSPPIDQRSVALFLFEELAHGATTWQAGARVEHARYAPAAGLGPRRFTNFSASAGVVWQPHEQASLSLNVARAARPPALEELYFLGPHVGNFVYEIGDDRLGAERATGVDAAFRWRGARVNTEVTAFMNTIDGFVFRRPTGAILLGLPVVEFVAADARLTGMEASAGVRLSGRWALRSVFDIVRGALRDEGRPLPRMPPRRVRGELRFQDGPFTATVDATWLDRQSRLYPGEGRTAGAALLRASAGWTFATSAGLHTVTARVDNATDRSWRNHLSFIKDLVPEMGRSIRLVYQGRF